jgi:hypothetical protein
MRCLYTRCKCNNSRLKCGVISGTIHNCCQNVVVVGNNFSSQTSFVYLFIPGIIVHLPPTPPSTSPTKHHLEQVFVLMGVLESVRDSQA